AADSTGLTPRTSSREAVLSCRRHGTSAAAAMQAKIATARTTDSSPSTTTTASEIAAASRMIAECRKRSGHGEKKNEGVSSIAMRLQFRVRKSHPFPTTRSGAAFPALPDIDGLTRRLDRQFGGGLPQPFRPGADDNLPKRQ